MCISNRWPAAPTATRIATRILLAIALAGAASAWATEAENQNVVEGESEAQPWQMSERPVLVHKLFVATYLTLWQNPELENASLTVRTESALKTWTKVSAVLLEIDGRSSEFACSLESQEIAVVNVVSLNPYADIDRGTSVCEIPWEVASDLRSADRVEVGFQLPNRKLDAKRLKPKQLERLRELVAEPAR